jgi:hypothetical protein
VTIFDEWSDWTDEALREYEQRLYDDAMCGEDNWELRDAVLWEMAWRGMLP